MKNKKIRNGIFYKVHGYTLLNMMIYIVFCIVLFSGGVSMGQKFVENYKKDLLIHQCDVLDASLVRYARMHQAVRTDTIHFNQDSQLKYIHTPIYPKTLEQLGTIQNEQGYFSKAIDLSQFNYKVTKHQNGTMTYKLEVTLPDGKKYISPRSDK